MSQGQRSDILKKKNSSTFNIWPLITLWGHFKAPYFKMLNDAKVASACFYVRTCQRVRNSKKLHLYALSIFQVHSFVCQLNYISIDCVTFFCYLTVGYSTCHWCHVMERESFENADIGKIMNDNFVCIKVDREERPDVDRVYMTFVQVCYNNPIPSSKRQGHLTKSLRVGAYFIQFFLQ